MARAQLDRSRGEVARMFDAVADRYDRMNAVMTLRSGAPLARGRRPGAVASRRVIACSTSLPAPAPARCRSEALGARRRRLRLLARACSGRPATHPGLDARGRRRAAAAVPRRRVRRGDDLLRAPQRCRRRRRAAGAGPGHATAGPAGRAGDQRAAAAADAGGARLLRRSACCRASPGLLSSNGEAYAYLAESVGAWPAPAALAERIAAAGWAVVRWRQLLLGAVALHSATKPAQPEPLKPARAGRHQAGGGLVGWARGEGPSGLRLTALAHVKAFTSRGS